METLRPVPGPGFTEELLKIPELGAIPDKVEVTAIDSAIKKYIRGRKDLPDLELEFLKDPETGGSAWNVFGAFGTAVKWFRIVFPDGSSVIFSGSASIKQSENDGNDALKFVAVIVLDSDFDWADAVDVAALTCAVAAGVAAGMTKATATPDGGNTLMIAITRTAQRTPFTGELAPVWSLPYTSGSDYPAAADQYIGVYEVNATNVVQKFHTEQLEAADIGA